MIKCVSVAPLDRRAESLFPGITGLGPFSNFPKDVVLLIFDKLASIDLLGFCRRVSKSWQLFSDCLLRRDIQHVVYGKNFWEKHLGNVGEESPIPYKLIRLLHMRCPIYYRRDVRASTSHCLVWLPMTVDGFPFDFSVLQRCGMNPKKGKSIKILDPSDAKNPYEAPKYSTWIYCTQNAYSYHCTQYVYTYCDDVFFSRRDYCEKPPSFELLVCLFVRAKRLDEKGLLSDSECTLSVNYPLSIKAPLILKEERHRTLVERVMQYLVMTKVYQYCFVKL